MLSISEFKMFLYCPQQIIILKPVTGETLVESKASPCGIYGGPSGNGTGLSLSTSAFTSHCHSTNVPHNTSTLNRTSPAMC